MFGSISAHRPWLEQQMTHPSNSFCEGGLDADTVKPYCRCGVRVAGEQHPWVVSLIKDPHEPESSAFCQGTLVASNYVVTAASCVHGHAPALVYVLIGVHNADKPSGERLLHVSRILVHDNYTTRANRTDNIALLKLTSEVDLSSHPPACLAREGVVSVGLKAQVYDYGDGVNDAKLGSSEMEVEIVNCSAENEDIATAGSICVNNRGNCQVGFDFKMYVVLMKVAFKFRKMLEIL